MLLQLLKEMEAEMRPKKLPAINVPKEWQHFPYLHPTVEPESIPEEPLEERIKELEMC